MASCACWVWGSSALGRQDGSSSGIVHTQAVATRRNNTLSNYVRHI